MENTRLRTVQIHSWSISNKIVNHLLTPVYAGKKEQSLSYISLLIFI